MKLRKIIEVARLLYFDQDFEPVHLVILVIKKGHIYEHLLLAVVQDYKKIKELLKKIVFKCAVLNEKFSFNSYVCVDLKFCFSTSLSWPLKPDESCGWLPGWIFCCSCHHHWSIRVAAVQGQENH